MRSPIITVCLSIALFHAPALLAAGEADHRDGEAPPLALEPYVFEAADGTRVDAELGTFSVPENRRRPDSRRIDLKFVRFKSTAAEPGPPIVYLAGGPGGSGTGAARGSRFGLFMRFREIADVIAFDQRGTGMSGREDLRCAASLGLPLDVPGDPAAMLAAARPSIEACVREVRERGVDLAGYNSVESADDLNDLRRALGVPKITLWGISYGTHLSLAVLKRHGAHVDRAILAGLEGPDQSYKLPSNVQRLMERIAAMAKADPAVSAEVPDLLGTLGAILDKLEREPLVLKVTDPRNGQKVDVGLSAFDVRMAVSNLLRGPSSFAILPDAIAKMSRGDFTAAALAVGEERVGPVGSAMSYAMDCASGATEARLERIAAEARKTLLGDAINFPFPGICDAWGVPDLGDAYRAPVETAVPALFISGTLDGRTPPSNAEEILAGFANGVHLVIEGAGHSDPLFLSSPAIAETMVAFLAGEPVKDRRITLPPVRLVPPRRTVEVPVAVLERYVGTYRINDAEVREVTLAGGRLFTQRTGGGKLAITPQSETEFYYDGSPTYLEFVLGDDGEVTHMVMYQGGEKDVAVKMD